MPDDPQQRRTLYDEGNVYVPQDTAEAYLEAFGAGGRARLEQLEAGDGDLADATILALAKGLGVLWWDLFEEPGH